jgi:Vanadium chloroperoxidase N-terminal domain/PAP2 superfamily
VRGYFANPLLEQIMNIVLFWNNVLLECSRRDFTRGYANSQQPGPIRTSRAMAIVHLAIHDAVAFKNGLPAAAYLNKKAIAHTVGAPPAGSVDDIVGGAAVTTLKAMYPRYATFIDDSYDGGDNARFNYGEEIANALLASRVNDGSDVMLTPPQVISPVYGQHRADPFAPGQPRLGLAWGNVKRFTGNAHKPLAPFPGHGTPDYLTAPGYKADFDEVIEFGAADRRSRTAEQERIGVYWAYDGVMNLGVPPRLYNQVARKIVATKSLSVARTAELFAQINVAMADAGIDAWHYKYLYDLWRPVVGVRAEDAPDGDPFWAPLGAPQTNVTGRSTFTPPFPAYPSGHATFGAALFQSLRLALDTSAAPMTTAEVMAEEIAVGPANAAESFTFVSDELDGVAFDSNGSVRQSVPITYPNYARPVWENSVSRIYLGVHWRFDGLPRNAADNIGGVPLGLAIGEEVHAFFNNGTSLGGSV